MPAVRRTQAQRREATIGKLLQATLECLAERGYAGTSTSAICKRAGVSQGGLFRHFDTRLAIIVAATEQVGNAHVRAIEQMRDSTSEHTIETILGFAREITRSDPHAAWHEVMVAARTDEALREAVHPVLERYEAALHTLARSLVPTEHPDPKGMEVLVMSMLHMFDSEAVTRRVYSSPGVEETRLKWAIETVRAAINGPTPYEH